MADVAGLALQATPTPSDEAGVGPDLLAQYWPALYRAGWFVLGFAVVGLIGWFVLAPALSRVIDRRNPNNRTLVQAIRRYAGLLFLLAGVLAGAAMAGFQGSLQNSAIVVAAATLAIGVAGQTVIGSIVSGLALVVDPEFNVGDYITWADGEGSVRAITLRVTRIQTPDGELITVPNEELTGQAVTRPYGWGRYRVNQAVTVDYGDDVEEVLAILEAVAADLPMAAQQPEPRAVVSELREDLVVASVFFWIDDPGRRDVIGARSAFARDVTARFDEAGVTLGPLQTVQLGGEVAVSDARGRSRLVPEEGESGGSGSVDDGT